MKYHNIINNNRIYDDSVSKRRKMPASVANEIAKKAAAEEYRKGSFGAPCERCNIKYSQSYLVYVYLGSFKEGYVCKDCAKRYHLQKA